MSFKWHDRSTTATATTATIKTIGRPAWKSIEKRTKVGRIMLQHTRIQTRAHLRGGKGRPGARDQARGRRQTMSQRTVDRQLNRDRDRDSYKDGKGRHDGVKTKWKVAPLLDCHRLWQSTEQSKRSHWPWIRLTIPIAVERLAAVLALWPPQTITTATTKEMPWNRHLPASYYWSSSSCSCSPPSFSAHPQQSQQSA